MYDRQPIELLPDLVIGKIAAGEVIERPASVLKELIENAIDAGATAINIVSETAGFSLIRVTDNGCGMGRNDLAKSLLRHATSKIRSADDLFAVTTMGFRGEALASIAAVSRMSVISATDASGLGHKIESQGGVPGEPVPASHGQGTTVEVRDLFYNLPARKKFMKSQRSEQLALTRVVEQVAIPFPSIRFCLTIDGRKTLDLPPAATPLERIGAVAGTEFARSLIGCRSNGDNAAFDLTCYVSSPERPDKRARFQSLYVNLRRVDCDAVTYAIREAFEQYLGGHFRPSFFCFLSIDPGRIDVNVHPTKQQIKFENEREVAGRVYRTVKQGIGSTMVAPPDTMSAAYGRPGTETGSDDALQEQLRLTRPGSAGTTIDHARSFGHVNEGNTTVQDDDGEHPLSSNRQTIIPFPASLSSNEKEIDRVAGKGMPSSKDQEERSTAWDLISCYQIHEMYILAPIKNGILLIDQHAAHERVLFEQALDDMQHGRNPSQQLLFPVVVELTSMEKAVLVSGISCFGAFGFEIGDFGGNALSVSAIPFFMKANDVDDTLRSMVRYLLDETERDALQETEKRFAAAFACGAAIKAGQRLTQEEMNALVNSLFSAKNPYTCPHGRPTLIRMSMEELARRFLR